MKSSRHNTHPVGALRRRLILEAPTRSADGMGGAVEAWSPVATLYGEVNPLNGAEATRAGRLTGIASHEIVIRDRAGLTPRHRFRLGDRILQIHAVLAIGTLTPRLRCLCSERDL